MTFEPQPAGPTFARCALRGARVGPKRTYGDIHIYKYINIYTRNLKFAQLVTALAPLANYIQTSSMVLFSYIYYIQTSSMVLFSYIYYIQTSSMVLFSYIYYIQTSSMVLFSYIYYIQTSSVVLFSYIYYIQTSSMVLFSCTEREGVLCPVNCCVQHTCQVTTPLQAIALQIFRY